MATLDDIIVLLEFALEKKTLSTAQRAAFDRLKEKALTLNKPAPSGTVLQMNLFEKGIDNGTEENSEAHSKQESTKD